MSGTKITKKFVTKETCSDKEAMKNGVKVVYINDKVMEKREVAGRIVDIDGERYYQIANVDQMPTFFISLVSDSDHWFFVASNGGLTAGRVSPDTALFPYLPVDKVQENITHTGPKTLVRIETKNKNLLWEPFKSEVEDDCDIRRNIYKNLLGNKLCFEEINDSLQLSFRYTWCVSEDYGFVRYSKISNLGNLDHKLSILDGIQNILPANAPKEVQTTVSNLLDAYKFCELDNVSGLSVYSLYSAITDRAEPRESLKGNTAFSLGLSEKTIHISSKIVPLFRRGFNATNEAFTRGIRGAYFTEQQLVLNAFESKDWYIVTDIEKTQSQAIYIKTLLKNEKKLLKDIKASIKKGSDVLANIIAQCDGFQKTAENAVALHHYANVLFNVLRGGFFNNQYQVDSNDFAATIKNFNNLVFERNKELFNWMPKKLYFRQLQTIVHQHGDIQLERLAKKYLPITFGRRHGDPSRPWNKFNIRLKDQQGNQLLCYEGNWRDIFQNWEALLWSYPEFVDNTISEFVNASTADGYNPYRITKQGIDWEVEDPEDPWSYIGYWGDHQIIYLLKLLEIASEFQPKFLRNSLRHPVYSYANVPYKIKPFADLIADAKNTVLYDDKLSDLIEERVSKLGADGKLLLDNSGEVYQVNLIEKLLVPLLSKLSNLVPGGGIWLNTQRPEWNDANNALVGQGLSMVTLYYIRRYIHFISNLLEDESEPASLSYEVGTWMEGILSVLKEANNNIKQEYFTDQFRLNVLTKLGLVFEKYRLKIYQEGKFSKKKDTSIKKIKSLLNEALLMVDYSIQSNKRQDGMYHAYNLLDLNSHGIKIEHLYPMLEGQVAVLGSGFLDSNEAIEVLDQLFKSPIYREDQKSFMLYPDRNLKGFFEKNLISTEKFKSITLLNKMHDHSDYSIVEKDADGHYRFNADFVNSKKLTRALNEKSSEYGQEVDLCREELLKLYEEVFNHKSFTGRSGTMFAFEGVGSIYWHMVSKLLLAIQEVFFKSLISDCNVSNSIRLAKLYYQVRKGIGFNKTPEEYGAFPTDPYSHTPKHAGAQQPGMTGQVKEEILTRFGELGIRVNDGKVTFTPQLLRSREFIKEQSSFKYLDVDNDWKKIDLPKNALAFTWCQVPFIYELNDLEQPLVTIMWNDGKSQILDTLGLDTKICSELFSRNGKIKQVNLSLQTIQLFN